jgi:CRISPR-associated Csx2 family protein
MRRIFISFVGTGNPTKTPGYDTLAYRWMDGKELTTRFAQRAIIEALTPTFFDRIILLMTPESKEKHKDTLLEELLSVGCKEEQFIFDQTISTDQSVEQQWSWFHALLRYIQKNDEVVFDFTHGFRSVPIIFSTAIGYLQKVRSFDLLHAFYGYMEGKPPAAGEIGKGEIIDMAPFYRINAWADGVGQLIDSADATRLAELASKEPANSGFQSLNHPQLIESLQKLTRIVKDIQVNEVGKIAGEALKIIKERLQHCSGADQQLLELVLEKFTHLGEHLETERYDDAFFSVQFSLIEMLLAHDLHMQAFTVMRETLASFAMLGVTGKYRRKSRHSSEGRSYRTRFGELFVNMCQFPKETWKFPQEKQDDLAQLSSFWDALEAEGHTHTLLSFVPAMLQIRNGFDHAWTSKKEVIAEIPEKGKAYLQQLRDLYPFLRDISASLPSA